MGNTLAVVSSRRAEVSEPGSGEGTGWGNSLAVMSSRQVNIGGLAVYRGIRKGELTSCQIKAPGEC